MSSFQRMIAIPQEEYLALSTMQNVREPLAQHFYSLEKKYNEEEHERDPYRRMILQSSTLDQMKQVKDQMRNALVVATPKPYQSRAKALFQSLETFIKFNDKGEIYSDEGTLIPGSRLEDLIQHAVRDRRRNMTPEGWSEFLKILHDHNVPKSMLNRNTLDEMDAISSGTSMIKKDTSSEDKIKQKRQRIGAKRVLPFREKRPTPADFKRGKVDIEFLKRY